MNASLNGKLSAVKWGEYRLGDLFDIRPTKWYKLTNEQILSENGAVPLVSNSSTDNGVMGLSNLRANNSGNTISCSDTTLGASTMYYQKNDFIGYQHLQHLVPKFSPFNQSIALYIISACRVATSNVGYDYATKFNRDAMSSTKIYLPQTSDDKIDFDFMESFVAELEAERVAELEAERVAELAAYLKASELDNYELSSEEKDALGNYGSLEWDTYNLEKLFGKSTRGRRLKGDDRIAGSLPFVTAGEADEGISAYISNKVQVFEKNTTTIDMFGSAKYRNYKYGADDHVAVVHTEDIPMKASIFLTSAIHKASHTGKFDYGHNFYPKDADALDIMLPTKDNRPDYESMELLISAVQKLVIKDVVQFANRKLDTYKNIVLKPSS